MSSQVVFSIEKRLLVLDEDQEIIQHSRKNYFTQRRISKGFKEYFVRYVEEETGENVCMLFVFRDWERLNENGIRVSSGYKIEKYKKDSLGHLTKFDTVFRSNPE